MKKIICSIAAVAMAFFMAGCDKGKDITPEKMTDIATVIGRTAGYACELSKTKTEVKETIIKVLDIASVAVPTNGQTFVEAWTPIIDAELTKVVAEGKINADEAKIAKVALNVACEGIDYVFVKYPKAKEGKDLVGAAVKGFVTGFKSVVSNTLKVSEKPEIDEEALKYLKEKMAIKSDTK